MNFALVESLLRPAIAKPDSDDASFEAAVVDDYLDLLRRRLRICQEALLQSPRQLRRDLRPLLALPSRQQVGGVVKG